MIKNSRSRRDWDAFLLENCLRSTFGLCGQMTNSIDACIKPATITDAQLVAYALDESSGEAAGHLQRRGFCQEASNWPLFSDSLQLRIVAAIDC